MPPIDDTETDEETIALKKKRLRRVSFADVEITSIHIFNRDDDETPPSFSSAKSKAVSDAEEEVLQFFRDHADSDDSKELSTPGELDDEDDDDNDDVRKSFLRPIGSPSPGSSIAGSATSNDEDDFFGPVSANFIRPGKLSDSGASGDNHDLTMDSTAFSLHYRSLARSDSGELRTPTKVRLAFDEKTPSHVGTGSDLGSFMVLTRAKKSNLESPSGVEKSDGRDSNDMSLVGEGMRSYDYGRLSPRLEALLAGGSKDLDGFSVLDQQEKEMGGVVGIPVQLEEANLADNPIKLTPSLQSKEWTSNHLGIVQSSNQLSNENDNCSKAVVGTNVQENIESPSVTGRVLQFGSLTGHESGQFPHEGWMKHNLHDEIDHDSRKQYKSPLSGSISLLSAKRQKTFVDAADYGQLLHMTPSLNQTSSSHSKVVNMDRIVSSVHRSNSKFKIFEPSPLASSLRVGIERSRERLSKFRSSATSPAATIVSENHEDGKDRHVAVPIINLEKHLFSDDVESKHHDSKSITIDDDIEMPKSTENLSKNEVTMDLLRERNSPIQILGDAQLTMQVASPSQLTWLEQEAEWQVPMAGSDSATVQLNAENRIEMNFSNAPENFGSSSTKELNDLLQSSPGHLLIHSAEIIKQQILYGHHSGNHSEENRNSIADVTESNNSIGNMAIGIADNRAQEGNTQNLYSESSNGITVTSTDLFHQSEEELHEKSIEAFCDSANRSTNKLPFMMSSSKKELTQSPKGISNENNIESLAGEDIPTTNSNSKGHGNSDRKMQIHNSKWQFLVQDINSSGKEGGNVPTYPHGNHTDTNSTIDRSPNIQGSQVSDPGSSLDCSNASASDKNTIEGARKHWKDVSRKFCEDTKQMLSPCIDKLQIVEMDKLQDILFQQQKVQIFEIHCFQFHSQKLDEHSEVTNKRMAEAGSLLYKLAYEKARVQLMSLKRAKLMSRRQQLSSAVQESQMLKSNRICHPVFHGDERDASVDNFQISCMVNLERQCEVPSEKLFTLRHENEALHRKVNNLTNSFHGRFRMKGEPSCSETVALLNDHLKRRISFRFIRDEIQSWEVVDLGSRNDQQDIVLNYQGFVCQRLVISSTSPSMFISNTLNIENTNKNFPNMDACAAFSFVLNAETTAKYYGSKCLAQKTQITHLLLNNLLDVIKEVQLAQVEIRSLVQAKFHSPCAEQLALQLSFVDLNSSRKLILKLDLTSLRCGHYPSDIVPHHLQAFGTQKSQPGSLSDDLEAALAGVGVGHFRIIRLCRCVAWILHSAST